MKYEVHLTIEVEVSDSDAAHSEMEQIVDYLADGLESDEKLTACWIEKLEDDDEPG